MFQEFDLTEYLDTSKNNSEISQRLSFDRLLRKVFISASGKVDETDGWFEIKLADDARIEYRYIYVPYEPMRKESQQNVFRIHCKYGVFTFSHLIDTIQEDYMAGYDDFLIGAIWFYIDWKLGVNKLI